MDLDKNSSIMMLTSAGCNVLDYVIDGAGTLAATAGNLTFCSLLRGSDFHLLLFAGEVVAVDLNPRQNALLEMKMACIQALSYEDFWELFSAAGEAEVRRQILNDHYVKDIRPALSDQARAFWDDNQHELVNGILYAGMSGLAARGLMYVAWIFGLSSLIDGTLMS